MWPWITNSIGGTGRTLACIGSCLPLYRSLASLRIRGCVLTILILVLFPVSASADLTVNREYAIKAAFLYNFSLYTTWPEETFHSTSDPFVIGVLQDDPFGTILDKIAKSKKVEDRPIKVVRLDTLDRLAECHILYVPRTVSSKDSAEVHKALVTTHVLCVGETEGYAEKGGTVQLYLEGNRVRFAINKEAVEQRKLKMSSKILSLAKLVETKK